MKHKTNSKLECITLGDLFVRDSSMSQDEHFSVVKLDSQDIQASNFFGTKSVSDRPVVVIPQRNFRYEAELLIIDQYNGVENNFGFTKPIGGSQS